MRHETERPPGSVPDDAGAARGTALRAVVIGPNTERTREMEEAVRNTPQLRLVECCYDDLPEREIQRFLRWPTPDVAFVSIDQPERGVTIASRLAEVDPGLAIVAFGPSHESSVLLRLMEIGVRRALSHPFDPAKIDELVGQLCESLKRMSFRPRAEGSLFSFLPAKPGVGTSTVALNTALGLCKWDQGSTLLADFDVNSGILAYMLKINSSFSLMDIVGRSPERDEDIWKKLVTRCENLDVLPSGRPPGLGFRIESLPIADFLTVARKLYRFICADHSGNMEPWSIKLLKESERIFLVCTPEVTALHLARERYLLLKSVGLDTRVSVIVNRWSPKNLLTKSEIDKALGVPMFATLPNDYETVHAAILEGHPINAHSLLASGFAGLTAKLLPRDEAAPHPPEKRGLLSGVSDLFRIKHPA